VQGTAVHVFISEFYALHKNPEPACRSAAAERTTMGLTSGLSTSDWIIIAIIFVMLGGIVWMVEFLKRDAQAIKANQQKAKTKKTKKAE
jgi:H+/gluconate symporter-like permease